MAGELLAPITAPIRAATEVASRSLGPIASITGPSLPGPSPISLETPPTFSSTLFRPIENYGSSSFPTTTPLGRTDLYPLSPEGQVSGIPGFKPAPRPASTQVPDAFIKAFESDPITATEPPKVSAEPSIIPVSEPKLPSILDETRPFEITDIEEIVVDKAVSDLPGFKSAKPEVVINQVPEFATVPKVEIVLPVEEPSPDPVEPAAPDVEPQIPEVKTEGIQPALEAIAEKIQEEIAVPASEIVLKHIAIPATEPTIPTPELATQALSQGSESVIPQIPSPEMALAEVQNILAANAPELSTLSEPIAPLTATEPVLAQAEQEAFQSIGLTFTQPISAEQLPQASEAAVTIQAMTNAGFAPERINELIKEPLAQAGIQTEPLILTSVQEVSALAQETITENELKIKKLEEELLELQNRTQATPYEEDYYFLVDKETMGRRYEEVVRVVRGLLLEEEEISGKDIVPRLPGKRDDLESGLVRGTRTADRTYKDFLKDLLSIQKFTEVTSVIGAIVDANLKNTAVTIGKRGEWATHTQTSIVLDEEGMTDGQLLERIMQLQLELMFLTQSNLTLRTASVTIQHTSGETDKIGASSSLN